MTESARISQISALVVGGLLLLAGPFLSGCGSSRTTTDQEPTSDSESPSKIVVTQSSPDDEAPPDSAASGEATEAMETAPEGEKVLRPAKVRAQIDEAAQEWYGVPYEWAGESKDGVDCSGFVQIIYQEAFSYQLPRVTETQVQAGSRVPRSQVRAGDLVFFQPEGEWNHVGVYLGDDTFAHASSSDGVTKDSLGAPYWNRYYWTARRPLKPAVLPDSLTSELVAYRSPGAASDTTTAQARADTTGEQTGDAQDETITIASCEDADVECASPGSSDNDSSPDGGAVAAVDTTTRKGW